MKRTRPRPPVNASLPGRYGKMTARRLDREVSALDAEFVIDASRPLTRSERADERRARRQGRPRIGMGSKRVMITLERRLLRETDLYAKQLGMTRAALIARALRSALGRTG